MSIIKSTALTIIGIGILLLNSSCHSLNDSFAWDRVGVPSESISESPNVFNDSNEPIIIAEGKDGTSINRPAEKLARQMIFNADIYLLVDSISSTLDIILAESEKAKGYMQSMDSRNIVVRIPADKFKGFILQLGILGKITDKNIRGQDVTDKMMDINIRLDNSEKLRKRYAQLLEKGDKVEDMLKIEKALGEITETIERMKGQIRLLKNRIAFSTVKVHLNSSLPQKDIRTEIPIRWVRDIGSSIANTKKYSHTSYGGSEVVGFKLPEAFMKLSGNSYKTTAMSPLGIYLGITEEDNYEGGSLKFWTKLITNSLEKKSAMIVKSNNELKLDTGWKFQLITAEKIIRNQKYSYYLAVVVFLDSVYCYEIWGPEKEFNNNRENIIRSIKSMQIGTFWDIFFSPSLW